MSHHTEKKVSRLKRSGVADMKVALSKCSIQDGVGGRGEGGSQARALRRHSVSSSVTSTSSTSSRSSRTSRASRTSSSTFSSTSSSTFSSSSSRNSEANIRNKLSRDVLEKIGNRQLKVVTETSSKLKIPDATAPDHIISFSIEKCAACSKPLVEDGFFAVGQLYHKACFRFCFDF